MDIYLRADYYYVTENELEYLYQRQEIILPIKTNLLLVDFFLSYNNSSTYKQLLNTIVLNHYKDNTVTLYFYDNLADLSLDKYCQDIYQSSNTIIFDNSSIEFKLSLSQLIKLYYYVYLKYYNVEFGIIPLMQMPIITESSSFPYLISDLDRLINDYNNIQNVDDMTKYFNLYIRNPFLCYCQTNTELTVIDLENILISESPLIMKSIIEYINKRIETNASLTKLNNYKSILDEIKYSFITHIYNLSNSTYNSYLFDILFSLPTIIQRDNETTYYKMLYEYKPFHTQLISNYRIRVVSDDKMNIITQDDDFANKISDIKPSIQPISETIQKYLTINIESEQLVTSNHLYKIEIINNDNKLNALDDFANKIQILKHQSNQYLNNSSII